MGDAALDLMYGLVMESGSRWGEVAADFQIRDAEAVLGDSDPHLHFITRPRGGSKTSDNGGMALAWLATEAPARARGYVVASNAEQAGILIDAAAGFIDRTPELQGVLTVESEKIIAPNGAWVRVLTLSDSGSWGLRDTRLLILDEFAQWPSTRGAQRVYTAVRTTVQKVPGCRLVILTSAGEPSHWSYPIFKSARTDEMWRVSEGPGPVPWQKPEDLEALRRELRPSEYDRLILNLWSEDEDRAVSEEDWEAAAVERGDLPPRPGVKYVVTLDVGIYNDATVAVIAHAEAVNPDDRYGPRRVVVDVIKRWKGSKRQPVSVAAVKQWVGEQATFYNRARVYADPSQAVGIVQDLSRAGVRAEEWPFTATSVGQVANALVMAFRNRQVEVPDLPELRDELLRVRLRESSPGVTRLDHDRMGHDDQAVTLGMACHLLLATSGWSAAAAFKQFMRGEIAGRDSRPAPVVKKKPARRTARRCEHRWRGAACVFCEAPRPVTPAGS